MGQAQAVEGNKRGVFRRGELWTRGTQTGHRSKLVAMEQLGRAHLLDSMSKSDTRRCAACEEMPLMCGAKLANAARVFWCMYTSFSLDML